MMGDDAGPLIERPAHLVRVAAFAIGVMPITRAEYDAFLRVTGHPAPSTWTSPEFADPLQPVVSVNWFDAEAYCEWLARMTGELYRLPSEAEREYAARGGVEGARYPWGENYPDPATPYVGGPWTSPLPCGQGLPNGFGLYHVGDTVHEWCLDHYAEDYYSVSPTENPPGPLTGRRRVARGGAWRHQVPVSRCAHRTSLPPDRCFTDFGFRVAK